MSDHYHFTLDFLLRRDAPEALHSGLAQLANRTIPEAADLASLPPIVSDYLRAPHPPNGLDGDGFTYRYARDGLVFREERPEDGTHWVHFERSFHDDEFFNGGMYVIYWLIQFAAKDGYIGIKKAEYADLPSILIKEGGDIIETDLALNPSDEFGIHPYGGPIDPDIPARVLKNNRMKLADLLDGLGEMLGYTP